MRFFSLDVETANPDQSSICQIGLALSENGLVVQSWNWLINPEDYFDHFNVAVHGITESDVVNESLFSEVYKELSSLVINQIVVHHTAFDKVAINAVCKKYSLEPPNVSWIDSARVVRRVYPEFRSRGYGLKNLTNHFGIEFKHHDAEEDAIATAKIVNHCLVDSKTEIEHWREEQFRSTQSTKSVGGGVIGFIASEGDSNGKLFGEYCVFTGSLSMTKKEASVIANSIGISVEKNVTKKTTILVVGLQDEYKLAGYEKSKKHRVAEEKILKGQVIKILSENDFITLTESNK
jgi:DNA polymerase-3 subunit epsilon